METPQWLQSDITLILTHNTPLKFWPWDSKTLSDRELPVYWGQEGQRFRVVEMFDWEGNEGEGDDHVGVFLLNPLEVMHSTAEGDISHQYYRFYVYARHCRIEGTENDNDPKDAPIEKPSKPSLWKSRWKTFNIKGLGLVRLDTPVIKNGNFTWHEVTKSQSQRLPVTASVTREIIRFAEYMEEVRSRLGDRPMIINSWYRPRIVNQAVGGSSRSKHLLGCAADFVVPGMPVEQVYDILNSWHKHGGLAPGNIFTHIDLSSGSPPIRRWFYPNSDRKIKLWPTTS